MDLFNSNKRVYIIDTNALIHLDFTFKKEISVFTAIWEEIEELILLGCFKTIDFVEQEINDYEGKEEFLKKWIKTWKKYLVVKTDATSINATIPIINQEYNTGFLKASKQAEGKEEADPYLIGYCKIHNCVLISNESKTKPNKMPSIARKNGVECLDINDFLVERGLRIERKK
ncbi:MAG: DUF4411 family protein [Bacteroidetes bacterium]|nr:DUF4411 family protein [Bacteroidota bacterium]